MRRHNIDFHCYADDTQLYVPLQPGKSDVCRIFSCLAEIKNWMSENVLQLNDSKSDIVIMSPSGPSASNYNNLSSSLGALSFIFCYAFLDLFFQNIVFVNNQIFVSVSALILYRSGSTLRAMVLS